MVPSVSGVLSWWLLFYFSSYRRQSERKFWHMQKREFFVGRRMLIKFEGTFYFQSGWSQIVQWCCYCKWNKFQIAVTGKLVIWNQDLGFAAMYSLCLRPKDELTNFCSKTRNRILPPTLRLGEGKGCWHRNLSHWQWLTKILQLDHKRIHKCIGFRFTLGFWAGKGKAVAPPEIGDWAHTEMWSWCSVPALQGLAWMVLRQSSKTHLQALTCSRAQESGFA